jgi:hypothetical protein
MGMALRARNDPFEACSWDSVSVSARSGPEFPARSSDPARCSVGVRKPDRPSRQELAAAGGEFEVHVQLVCESTPDWEHSYEIRESLWTESTRGISRITTSFGKVPMVMRAAAEMERLRCVSVERSAASRANACADRRLARCSSEQGSRGGRSGNQWSRHRFIKHPRNDGI